MILKFSTASEYFALIAINQFFFSRISTELANLMSWGQDFFFFFFNPVRNSKKQENNTFIHGFVCQAFLVTHVHQILG